MASKHWNQFDTGFWGGF